MTPLAPVWLWFQDAVSMTAADELSSSVSEDTGFCSAPPLPSDPLDLCDLPDSQDPQDELDPAPPPTPAHDTPPGGYLCEDEPHRALPLPMALTPLPSLPDSPCGSVCEEDVTLALKELDERCEEEEADFSDMSR